MDGRIPQLQLLLVALIAIVPPARADVAYVERTKMKSMGAIGPIEVTRTVHLSGLRQREDSVTRFSLAIVRRTGVRQQDRTQVTLADKAITWTLDDRDRTYSEETFDSLRSKMQAVALAADSTTLTAEAPDADPTVQVERTDEARRIGPWAATKTVVKVATQVIDVASGVKRAGMIVWELWLAQDVPGVKEMRAFNQLYAQKLGTPSEFGPMAALGGSYPKSVKQAMLALKETSGYPVEWTWTLRAEISAEEQAALDEDARMQHEGENPHNDAAAKNDDDNDVQRDPTERVERHTMRNNFENTLHPLVEETGETNTDTGIVSADMGPGVEEGMMVLMKAVSTLDKADTAKADPAIFEIPGGYRKEAPGP